MHHYTAAALFLLTLGTVVTVRWLIRGLKHRRRVRCRLEEIQTIDGHEGP